MNGQQSHPDAQTAPWAANALTVLVETARRWEHIATDVLYPLLCQNPRLALAAGGATFTRLATLPTIDLTVLEAIEPLLPADRHIDLDTAAAAISTTLTRHRLAATSDPAEHARLHATHAWRLANAGLREEALAPAEEATDLYRRLAEVNPAAYLPDLAMSLWAYAWVCVNVQDNLSQALASVTEAIDLYQPLAQRLPQMFGGRLLAAYRTLADVLDGLGRAEEAADLRRQLDEATGGEPDAG